jgi:hypothetical protein
MKKPPRRRPGLHSTQPIPTAKTSITKFRFRPIRRSAARLSIRTPFPTSMISTTSILPPTRNHSTREIPCATNQQRRSPTARPTTGACAQKIPTGPIRYGNWSSTDSFTIDTSINVSTWYQTTNTQFNNDTLSNTEATTTVGDGDVGLSGSNTTGIVYSEPIFYSYHTSGNSWGSVSWHNATSSGTIVYHVEYFTSTSTWAIVPETDLSGNSAGFTSQPISLQNLDTSTYSEIRVRADFTKTTGTPRLQDWTVNWALSVAAPTQNKLFDNEKTATTTPLFQFTTTDPQNDSLVYQIQWSTDATFASGVTTRTSDTNAGFSDISSTTISSPFRSGDTIDLRVQPSDAMTNGSTYWWRVRAKDPGGGNAYSLWSRFAQLYRRHVSCRLHLVPNDHRTMEYQYTIRLTAGSAGDAVVSPPTSVKSQSIEQQRPGEAITTGTFVNGWDTTVRQDDIYSLSGTTTVLLKTGYYAVLYGDRFDSTAGTAPQHNPEQPESREEPISRSAGRNGLMRRNGRSQPLRSPAGGGIVRATSDNTSL